VLDNSGDVGTSDDGLGYFLLIDSLSLFGVYDGLVDLFMHNFLSLLMNHIFMLFLNKGLMTFVDDWLMDLMNVLLMNDWLHSFVDNRLMMLVYDLLMMLVDNILVMLVNDILHVLLVNGRKDVLLDDGSLSVLHNICFSAVIINDHSFLVLNHNRSYDVFLNNRLSVHLEISSTLKIKDYYFYRVAPCLYIVYFCPNY